MLNPDRFIVEFDKGLRTLFSQAHSVRAYPDAEVAEAPLSEADAAEMTRDIRGNKILNAIRGMAAVDADALVACLMAMGRIGLECEEIQAIDVNPLIIQDSGQDSGQAGRPVAVDALVILKGETS